jgi:hypothetical protein
MILPPVTTVSQVTTVASISATQNEQQILKYVEVNNKIKVEAILTLYDKRGNLIETRFDNNSPMALA